MGRGNADRLPALAPELTKVKVDVIVTQGTEATVAAQRNDLCTEPDMLNAIRCRTSSLMLP